MKVIDGRKRLAIIPDKKIQLGHTINDILGVKQSGVGRAGLLAVIERHGID